MDTLSFQDQATEAIREMEFEDSVRDPFTRDFHDNLYLSEKGHIPRDPDFARFIREKAEDARNSELSVAFIQSRRGEGLTHFMQTEAKDAIAAIPGAVHADMGDGIMIRFGDIHLFEEDHCDKVFESLFEGYHGPAGIKLPKGDLKDVLDPKKGTSGRLWHLPKEKQLDLAWASYKKNNGIKSRKFEFKKPSMVEAYDRSDRRMQPGLDRMSPRYGIGGSRRSYFDPYREMYEEDDFAYFDQLKVLTKLAMRADKLIVFTFELSIGRGGENRRTLFENLNAMRKLKNVLFVFGVGKTIPKTHRAKLKTLPFKASAYNLGRPKSEFIQRVLARRQGIAGRKLFSDEAIRLISSTSSNKISGALMMASHLLRRIRSRPVRIKQVRDYLEARYDSKEVRLE